MGSLGSLLAAACHEDKLSFIESKKTLKVNTVRQKENFGSNTVTLKVLFVENLIYIYKLMSLLSFFKTWHSDPATASLP